MSYSCSFSWCGNCSYRRKTGGGWGKREEVGGRGRRLGEDGGGWGKREEVGGRGRRLGEEGGGWEKREEVGGRGRRLGKEGGGTEEKEDREKDGKTEQTTITDDSV